tara:strand:- start:1221 stop:1721 length:501 start_codon:yes stop_codon:yes gene_type:complete
VRKQTTFVAASLFSVILSGCAALSSASELWSPEGQSSEPENSQPISAVEPRVAEIPVVFDPDASAEDNLAFFKNTIVASGAGSGITSIDAPIAKLVEAGFSSDSITFTPEATKRQFAADSISIAIEFAGQCLIGQYSPTWVSTAVADVLPTGECLIGEVNRVEPNP